MSDGFERGRDERLRKLREHFREGEKLPASAKPFEEQPTSAEELQTQLMERIEQLQEQTRLLESYVQSVKLIAEEYSKVSPHGSTQSRIRQLAGSARKELPSRPAPGWSIEAIQEFHLLNDIDEVKQYVQHLQSQATGDVADRLRVALLALNDVVSLQQKYRR